MAIVHPSMSGQTTAQLSSMKAHILASEQPWKAQYETMRTTGSARAVSGRRGSQLMATTAAFTPCPCPILYDISTTNTAPEALYLIPFLDDSQAAYTQALMCTSLAIRFTVPMPSIS